MAKCSEIHTDLVTKRFKMTENDLLDRIKIKDQTKCIWLTKLDCENFRGEENGVKQKRYCKKSVIKLYLKLSEVVSNINSKKE